MKKILITILMLTLGLTLGLTITKKANAYSSEVVKSEEIIFYYNYEELEIFLNYSSYYLNFFNDDFMFTINFEYYHNDGVLNVYSIFYYDRFSDSNYVTFDLKEYYDYDFLFSGKSFAIDFVIELYGGVVYVRSPFEDETEMELYTYGVDFDYVTECTFKSLGDEDFVYLNNGYINYTTLMEYLYNNYGYENSTFYELVDFYKDFNLLESELDLLTSKLLEYSYENGYDVGYNKGLIEGENIGTTNDTKFRDLFFSILDAPRQAIENIFNFEIFGVNIASLIFFLISSVLVFAIIKFFL